MNLTRKCSEVTLAVSSAPLELLFFLLNVCVIIVLLGSAENWGEVGGVPAALSG